MKKQRSLKIFSLILAMMMVFVLLCGCGDETSEQNVDNAGTIVEETDSSITIIDQAGREVTVDKGPENIALCYRVIIRFLLSLDQGDNIKGIGKTEPFLLELQPSLGDCADVGQGVADIEALAELKPDVFFHKANDLETLEAVEKLGIPAVGIEVETPDDMITALKIMGEICDVSERADELIHFYEEQLAQTDKLIAQIDKKKTAIVMGTSIGKVADSSMLQGEMLNRAGAVNCADELQATELWPTAGTEQIFQWNPEYIFITNSESAVYGVSDIMDDPKWSEVEAVKNGHVYLMPANGDSWEFPGTVSTLGIDYIMYKMYPELMTDEILETNVNDFYELTYHKAFDRSELGY